MVHVDLETLKNRYYNIGNGKTMLTTSDVEQLKALDAWQRNEVLEQHQAGVDDLLAEMMA